MAYKISTIFTASYDGLKNAVTGVKSQFRSVETSAKNAKQKISNTFSGLNTDFKKVNSSIKESTELLNSMIKTSLVGVATITAPSVLLGKKALEMAGQYEASTQTLQYTLGKSKQIVDDFVEHNAKSIGMAEQDAYKFANIYSNLLMTMTNDQKTNANFTNRLMQASAVIMSKTGRTFTDVADRIRSGLLGNTEAIEDLGVNVNVALLQTTDAFKEIANGRGWDDLAFQEQQQVRLLGILEQTSKKYGEEVGDNLSLKLSQTASVFDDIKTEASQFLSIGLQPLINTANGLLNNILVFVKYLNTLDDATKQNITRIMVVIAILPVASLMFTMLIKAINSYIIFTKIASATTVTFTKTTLGLLGSILMLAAGIAMLGYGLGLFGKNSKNVNKVTNSTDMAKKAVDGLSASQKDNTETAKKASKANKELADNLQQFDEINKLNIDKTSTNNNADKVSSPVVDLSGIDTSAFKNIDGQVANINEQVENFKQKLENLKPVLTVVGGIITAASLATLIVKGKGLLETLGLIKGATATAGATATTAGAQFTRAGYLAGQATAGLGSTLLSVGAVLIGVVAPIATSIWAFGELKKGVFDLTKETEIFDSELKKNVSDATQNAINPFIDNLNQLGTTIWGLSLGKVVKEEDVTNVKNQTQALADTLQTNLVDKTNKMKEQLNNVNLFPDASKREAYLETLNQSLTNEQSMIDFYQNKINGIVETAANERRGLTDVERVQIEELQRQMGDTGIDILSENQKEALAIKTKFNDKFYTLSSEQLTDAVKQAKELRDKTVKEAEDEYDQKVLLAEEMKATLPTFTEEMYNEMIEDAKKTKEDHIKVADDEYQGIVDTVKEKYPEVSKLIDFETGEQKNGFQIFGTWVSDTWTNISDSVSKKAKEIKDGIIKKFEDLKTKFKNIWNDIKTWFSGLSLKIKTPHISWTTTPATGWVKTVLDALNIPAAIPKLNVSWYAKGGVFDSKSIIGVGEYAGAKSNPEIVTPKSIIYDTVMQAQEDKNNYSNNFNGNETIRKKLELEIDLKSGGVKFGKQIVELVLDANDFYDLGLSME